MWSDRYTSIYVYFFEYLQNSTHNFYNMCDKNPPGLCLNANKAYFSFADCNKNSFASIKTAIIYVEVINFSNALLTFNYVKRRQK